MFQAFFNVKKNKDKGKGAKKVVYSFVRPNTYDSSSAFS